MSWRSPYQTTKSGGVPFPALTPWANSPGQTSDSGSPMQTTPTPIVKSVVKRGATTLRKSSLDKASPMDAAPYTPLSARCAAHVPDTTSKFVGKLSFTPHLDHQRLRSYSPVSKRSPVVSPDQRSAPDNSPAQPPVTSMYADTAYQMAAEKSDSAQQASIPGQCPPFPDCTR